MVVCDLCDRDMEYGSRDEFVLDVDDGLLKVRHCIDALVHDPPTTAASLTALYSLWLTVLSRDES